MERWQLGACEFHLEVIVILFTGSSFSSHKSALLAEFVRRDRRIFL